MISKTVIIIIASVIRLALKIKLFIANPSTRDFWKNTFKRKFRDITISNKTNKNILIRFFTFGCKRDIWRLNINLWCQLNYSGNFLRYLQFFLLFVFYLSFFVSLLEKVIGSREMRFLTKILKLILLYRVIQTISRFYFRKCHPLFRLKTKKTFFVYFNSIWSN